MSFLIFDSEEITLGFGLGHILAVSAKLMGIPLRQAPLSCPLPLLRHYGINWFALCAGWPETYYISYVDQADQNSKRFTCLCSPSARVKDVTVISFYVCAVPQGVCEGQRTICGSCFCWREPPTFQKRVLSQATFSDSARGGHTITSCQI